MTDNIYEFTAKPKNVGSSDMVNSQAEVIERLEYALELAKEGKIKSIALCGVLEQDGEKNRMVTYWYDGEQSKLCSAIDAAKFQIQFEDHMLNFGDYYD